MCLIVKNHPVTEFIFVFVLFGLFFSFRPLTLIRLVKVQLHKIRNREMRQIPSLLIPKAK